MTDFPTQLEDFMIAKDFHIRGRINYNISEKFQRFSDAQRPHKRAKDLFVVIHQHDRGATFGDWQNRDNWHTYWNMIYGKPSGIELAEYQIELMQIKRNQLYEQSKAIWRAQEFWHRFYASTNAWDHPYIMRKRIVPYYAKQVRSWLLVPISDIDHKLITIQIIKPDGFKRCWKKTSMKDLMVWLSEPLPENYDGIIRICEGYATGCTIYEAIGSPVVCALNAFNIISVCKQLREKFPNANLKICADNDKWGRQNPGMDYALQADRASNAPIYYPDFDGLDVSGKPTDWNDLMCLDGINIVEVQLLKSPLLKIKR